MKKPATAQRVKVIVTFLDEKSDKINEANSRPSAQLRGAWKNAGEQEKDEINTYFDNIRNEWGRDI